MLGQNWHVNIWISASRASRPQRGISINSQYWNVVVPLPLDLSNIVKSFVFSILIFIWCRIQCYATEGFIGPHWERFGSFWIRTIEHSSKNTQSQIITHAPSSYRKCSNWQKLTAQNEKRNNWQKCHFLKSFCSNMLFSNFWQTREVLRPATC